MVIVWIYFARLLFDFRTSSDCGDLDGIPRNRPKWLAWEETINLVVSGGMWNQSYLIQFTSLQFVAISYRDSTLKVQSILIAFNTNVGLLSISMRVPI